MSIQRAPVNISFLVSATISAFRIVKPTGANRVGTWDTATAHILGVAQEDSKGGSDTSVLVCIGGTARTMAGASISAGALITAQTATGLAIEAGTGLIDTTTSAVPKLLGLALDAADTNSVCEVLLIINNVRKTASA